MITPEYSNEFPRTSTWWLVKPHAYYCVDILTARWLRLLKRTDCYVWLHQKKLWLFMFEMHLINGITDEPPPLPKLNVKTGPLRSLYFGIYYSFSFRRLLFFLRFWECFPVISGFSIAVQYRVYYRFSTIFWVLASGHPSAKFPPSYVTAPDQSKVCKPWSRPAEASKQLQIRAMRRASSSVLQ